MNNGRHSREVQAWSSCVCWVVDILFLRTMMGCITFKCIARSSSGAARLSLKCSCPRLLLRHRSVGLSQAGLALESLACAWSYNKLSMLLRCDQSLQVLCNIQSSSLLSLISTTRPKGSPRSLSLPNSKPVTSTGVQMSPSATKSGPTSFSLWNLQSGCTMSCLHSARFNENRLRRP
jgi:hypothetical protein